MKAVAVWRATSPDIWPEELLKRRVWQFVVMAFSGRIGIVKAGARINLGAVVVVEVGGARTNDQHCQHNYEVHFRHNWTQFRLLKARLGKVRFPFGRVDPVGPGLSWAPQKFNHANPNEQLFG
jgi:hypothetical protein